MDIDATLVARLVASQFQQWADLPIVAAEPNGWDNRTFRLGPDLLVRPPSAETCTRRRCARSIAGCRCLRRTCHCRSRPAGDGKAG